MHNSSLSRTRRCAPVFVFLAALVVLAGCGDAPAPAPKPVPPPALVGPQATALDALLAGCVEGVPGNRFAQPAPGAILLVDTPQGRYLKARGVADIETKRPLGVADVMQIGSNTKMFTGVLLLQLEEDGKLSLDDPLSRWLPGLAARLPHGARMTLRHLATHTSGAWDYGDAIIGDGVKDPELLHKGYAPHELVEYAIEHGTPDFEPGAEGQWKYSNTGYILLGMVLEKASGASYAALLQKRIFDPLDMRSATLLAASPPADAPVHGYYDHGKGFDATVWNPTQGWAAGAIACTAEDLARFGHALLEGTLFSKAATLPRMTAFVTGRRGLLATLSVGYGIGLQQLADNAWGHRGQTLGFNSILMVFPEERVLAVALTNDGVGPSMYLQSELGALYEHAQGRGPALKAPAPAGSR